MTWRDSSRTDGWCDRERVDAVHGDTIVETIGYVVRDDEDHLSVVHSYTDHEVLGLICIPVCSIIKRRYIR